MPKRLQIPHNLGADFRDELSIALKRFYETTSLELYEKLRKSPDSEDVTSVKDGVYSVTITFYQPANWRVSCTYAEHRQPGLKVMDLRDTFT